MIPFALRTSISVCLWSLSFALITQSSVGAEPESLSAAEVVRAYEAMHEEDLGEATSYDVKDLKIDLGHAKIEMPSCILTLTNEIAGGPWAAVCLGKVRLSFEPSCPVETSFLKTQDFEPGHEYKSDAAVLFFSGRWIDRVKQSCTEERGGAPRAARRIWSGTQDLFRRSYRLNMESCVLDCLTREPTTDYFAIFLEDVKGASPSLLCELDCRRDEQLTLYRECFDEFNMKCLCVLSSCEAPTSFPPGSENEWTLQDVNIDVDIGREHIEGNVAESLVCLRDGLRMVPVELPAHEQGAVTIVMKVRSAQSLAGDDVEFIFVDEQEGSHCWLALDQTTKSGEELRVRLEYVYENGVDDQERGNYSFNSPVWFPRAGSYYHSSKVLKRRPDTFGRFRLKATTPGGCGLVATGPHLGAADTPGDHFQFASDVPVILPYLGMGEFVEVGRTGVDPSVSVCVSRRLSSALGDLHEFLLRNSTALHGEGLYVAPDELDPAVSGPRMLAEASGALKVLKALFGPLPGHKINIVQHQYWNYGFSMSGMVIVPPTAGWSPDAINKIYEMGQGTLLGSKRTSQLHEFRRSLIAHELAHQWLGCRVACRSYRDYWLFEGLPTYAAILAAQTHGGVEALLSELAYLRQEIFDFEGSFERANDIGPICLGPRLAIYKEAPDGTQLAYNKGAYVLHMLRMLMYDDAAGSDAKFFSLCKDFVDRHRYQCACTDDFRKLAEEKAGMDLNWFFKQWLETTEVPTYRFGWKCDDSGSEDKTLTVRVEQADVSQSFKMPVRYIIASEDGRTEVRSIWVQGKRSEEKVPVSGDIKGVIFLPLGDVLCHRGEDLKL